MFIFITYVAGLISSGIQSRFHLVGTMSFDQKEIIQQITTELLLHPRLFLLPGIGHSQCRRGQQHNEKTPTQQYPLRTSTFSGKCLCKANTESTALALPIRFPESQTIANIDILSVLASYCCSN